VLLEPGAPLCGRYTITRLLGEGGMGLVYAAHDQQLDLDVAIKVLRDEVMEDREAVTRFAREARTAATLKGPHVARILNVGEAEGGRPFMVMELLEGNDLGAEIERRTCLPVYEAVDYVSQACEAIAEAHGRGIVHRDLKPANLFLVRVGSRRVVKVLDFGISRFDGTEVRVTQTQTAFGTPLYMSPEAMRSAKHSDARSDVWSFGVILYELVTGRPPFIGDTPTAVAISVTVDTPKLASSLRPDLPRELEEVILRALDKDASRRFQTAGELGAALQQFLELPRNAIAPRDPQEFGLRSTSPAVASSQKLGPTTQTGEPLSGAVPQESRGRVGLVASVAVGALAVTLSVVALINSRRAAPLPVQASGGPAAEAPGSEPVVTRLDPPNVVASGNDPSVGPTPPASVSSLAATADVTTRHDSPSVKSGAPSATASAPPTARPIADPPPARTTGAPPVSTGAKPGGNPLLL